MRPVSGWLYPAAVALCLCGGLSARADLVTWTYNWTPSVTSLSSDTGSGHMSISNEPTSGPTTGSSDTVASNLHIFSTAPVGTPDSFNNKAVSWSLVLTDTPSGKSGTLNFAGTFGGTFSSGHSSVTFTASAPLTQSITLGNDTYTVTFGAFTPPPPPSAGNAGSVGAHIVVTGGTSPPPNNTPEPGTMLLGGLGLSVVGLAGWGKRRREKLSALATA